MKDSILYYSVGPLLYCPANHKSLANSLIHERFGRHFSLAVCLEDTIQDDRIAEAEHELVQTIHTLFNEKKKHLFFLPKIFIRVRSPQQIPDLMERFGDAGVLITGFIIPKFSLENADSYISEILSVNERYNRAIYMMPIFESPSMIHLQHRHQILYTLKEKLDAIEPLVLNIRVGGNDLCHVFGFRRHVTQSIHDIRPISDIFSDIITVFGMDYVISGPVWEYYNGSGWDRGLQAELAQDRLCGFTGKTVIHPNQIPLVNDAYRVSKEDYEDAKAILHWEETAPSLVHGNVKKARMNECKTHSNWAMQILMLAEAFGVVDSESSAL